MRVLSMEIVLLIALVIAVIWTLSLARKNGDASEGEPRRMARSDDQGGRLKRWPTRRRR